MLSHLRHLAAAIAGGAAFVLTVAFAAVALPSPARAGLLIEIDKTTQRMSISRDGVPLHVWPVSTGRAGHDTPSGRYTPFRLEVDHYSREWDDAPMPHSIFFTKRGHAIHGSYEVRKLGSAASAGCVRLAPENAARLFRMVQAEGLANVRVEIGGEVRPRRAPSEEIARRAPQVIAPQYAAPRYPDPRYGRPAYREPADDYHYEDARPRYAPPLYYNRRGFGYGWD